MVRNNLTFRLSISKRKYSKIAHFGKDSAAINLLNKSMIILVSLPDRIPFYRILGRHAPEESWVYLSNAEHRWIETE